MLRLFSPQEGGSNSQDGANSSQDGSNNSAGSQSQDGNDGSGGNGGSNASGGTLPTDVVELQGMIKELRRENKRKREDNTALLGENDKLKERVTALEKQAVTGTENATKLLEEKDARIASLEAELSKAGEVVRTYNETQESKREELLNKLPESVRGKYKELSISVLENLVADIGSASASGDNTNAKGRENLDEALATAIAAGDDEAIVRAVHQKLGKETAT